VGDVRAGRAIVFTSRGSMQPGASSVRMTTLYGVITRPGIIAAP